VSLVTTQQSLKVGDVTTIVVTPVVREEPSGQFVRELRIFAADVNVPTSPLEPARPGPEVIAVTLRLVSDNRESLHIAVPASEF
jgi:hypothetical protein